MKIETIRFNNKQYPKFQSNGFSARFSFPFALEVCKGKGFDIGCNREEWALPGSTPIDIALNEKYHAKNLPFKADFIYSSHCLEHIEDWVSVLDYWCDMLLPEGVIFLYLPDYSQEYWRPWNNRKHCNVFFPKMLMDYFMHKGYENIFVSGVDLNNSFMLFCNKPAVSDKEIDELFSIK